MRRQLAVAALALVLFLALMPLGAVMPGANGPAAGLTARSAEDTVWDGILHEAHLGGVALGDVHVALEPLPLLIGEARFEMKSTALAGTLTAVSGLRGVHGMTGSVETGGRFAPLPIGSVAFDRFGATFRDGNCLRAEGVVRTSLSDGIGGLALPQGLSGTARCDGAALLIPLAAPSGLERVDLRIRGDGRWEARASVDPGDPALAAKLQASGFSQGAGGLAMRFSGHL